MGVMNLVAVFIKLYVTFEHKEQTSRLKPSVGNFKRSVFVPGNFTQVMNPDAVDDEETISETPSGNLRFVDIPVTSNHIESSDVNIISSVVT